MGLADALNRCNYNSGMSVWSGLGKLKEKFKAKAIFKLAGIFGNYKQGFRWVLGINLAMLAFAFLYNREKANYYLTMQAQYHADLTVPLFMRKFLYGLYAKHYQVNLDEVPLPLEQYPTFSSFFTRQITREAPEEQPNTISSPCDGKVLTVGEVTSDECHIIKGRNYSLTELFLGQSPKDFDPIHTFVRKNKDNKLFQVIIYLAPGDYHRFHAPARMTICKEKRIEGGYDPVNEESILSGKKVYHTNGRVVLFSEWSQGLLAMALVGALNVSRIQLLGKRVLNRSEELGYFNLGSTIVMLVEAKDIKEWRVKQGDRVKYGQPLLEYLL